METGGGRANSYFPMAEFLTFAQGIREEPMVKKLREFNQQVGEEARVGEEVLGALPALASAPPAEPAPLLAALATLLSWEGAFVFPALDLCRAALLNPAAQELLLETDILNKLFSTCLANIDREAPAAAQMLALRTLANMFATVKGEQLLRTYRDSVLTRIFEKLFPIAEDNKQVQIAAATLALNYSVSLHRRMDDESQVQLLSTLAINFFTFITDWEARFRTLVAFGTMLSTSAEALDYARTLEAKEGARGWRILEGPAKVSECASFIEEML